MIFLDDHEYGDFDFDDPANGALSPMVWYLEGLSLEMKRSGATVYAVSYPFDWYFYEDDFARSKYYSSTMTIDSLRLRVEAFGD